MALVYQVYYLPISVLSNFPHVFSYCNLKYKLLPQLTRSGLVKRVLIGYNRDYGENNIEKGKALYDVLKLTAEGIKYITREGINEESKLMRDFYRKQLTHSDPKIEERLKRSIETDIMFDSEFFIKEILKSFKLTEGTVQTLMFDVNQNKNIKYFRAIECKRTNLDLGTLRSISNIRDYTNSTGNSISGSKFFGLYEGPNKDIVVYNAGYYNAYVSPKNEEDITDKVTAETGRKCNACAYIYHDPEKIRSLIDMSTGDYEWRKDKSLLDVRSFSEIYLLPYSKQTTEFGHLNISMFIDGPYNNFLLNTPCFNDYDLFINKFSKKKAEEESLGTFDAADETANYIIGYLPELRRLRQIIIYYRKNPNAKELNIICSKNQKEFYEKILKELKENYLENKLNFILTEFNIQKGGDKN